jgi:hypothetical protein
MLERAMNLKKKRNLEPTKGNRFLALKIDDLSQMAKDVNIKVVNEGSGQDNLFNKMLIADHDRFEGFAEHNPKSILPVNLDIDQSVCLVPLEGQDVAVLFPLMPLLKSLKPQSFGLRLSEKEKIGVRLGA